MHDVIIVGGGMAGLSAALAAGEAGADVLVLESEPTVGGSMALSGGLIWAPASYELARQWVPRGNPELQRMLVDEHRAGVGLARGARPPARPGGACLKDRMGRGRLMAVGGPGRAGRGRRSCSRPCGARAPRCSSRRASRPPRPATDGWTVDLDARRGVHERVTAAVVFCGGGFQNSERAGAPLHQPVARGDGRPQQPLERRRRAAQPRAARRIGHPRHALLLRAHAALHPGQGVGQTASSSSPARCTSATTA